MLKKLKKPMEASKESLESTSEKIMSSQDTHNTIKFLKMIDKCLPISDLERLLGHRIDFLNPTIDENKNIKVTIGTILDFGKIENESDIINKVASVLRSIYKK